jgi:hypothetical protein
MVPIRKIYWLWLVLGIALLFYGVYTGGGLAGLFFYWQLQAFGTIFPGTHALLSIPLIFFPIIALAMDADRRRTAPIDISRNAKQLGKWFTIGGFVFLIGAGLCYWRTTLFPDPHSPLQRIALDEMAPDATVAECRASLIGRFRGAYGVRYEEVMNGRFGLHSKDYHHFVPVTRSDWRPDQPVRFLVDTNGEPVSLDAGTRGLLLRGQLPGFVRRALTNKGVLIADDVMVFSTRREFGRTPWFVSTALCSIGAFLFIAMGFAWPRTRLRSEKELAVLRPRFGRYVSFALGGAVMLIGLAFAIGKLAHIVSAASTEGVITNVQEGSQTIAKYSFYVEYNTPQGRFDRFARTSTPFERKVGDIVTVIYKPDQPEKPEFLALDDEWIGYGIVIAVGAAVVLFGAIFFRPKAISRPGS